MLALVLTHALSVHAQPVGQIKSVGSDTMQEIMSAWSEAFIRSRPGVGFEMEARGSSTAPQALRLGESHLAPMSRAMTTEEIEAFERRRGYEPTVFRVAIDALAVFVHRDNPVQGLSMDQINSIFRAPDVVRRACSRTARTSTSGTTSRSAVWAESNSLGETSSPVPMPGVDPVWWTPDPLRRRSPQCHNQDHPMRRSSGSR